MSKKMMKRSLALGALMAFVITGSAWAEDRDSFGGDITLTGGGTYEVEDSTKGVKGVMLNTSDKEYTIDNSVGYVVKAYDSEGKSSDSAVMGFQARADGSDVDNINVSFNNNAMFSAETNYKGTGGNQVTALSLTGDATVTLNGNVTATAVSTSAEGKSVYGIAAAGYRTYETSNDRGVLLQLNGKEVNINVKSATNHAMKDHNDKPVSEAALDAGVTGIYLNDGRAESSENTTINITVTGTGDGTGNNGYRAASAIGIENEDGHFDLKGTNIIKVDSFGGDAYGVSVDDEYETSATGDVSGTATTVMNNTKMTVTSDTGNAYGVYTKVGQPSDTVTLKNTGKLDATVTSTSGTAHGVYGENGARLELADTTITATSKSDAAHGLKVTGSDTTADVTGNLTITASGSTVATGVNVQKGAYVTLGNDKNDLITIEAESTSQTAPWKIVVGLQTYADDAKLEVNAGTVNVTAKSTGKAWAYGVSANGANTTAGAGSHIKIDANDIIINTSSSDSNRNGALNVMSGSKMKIEGNLTATGTNSIIARGNAELIINESGTNTVNLNGDIRFDGKSTDVVDAKVDINLSNAGSSLTGKIYTDIYENIDGNGDVSEEVISANESGKITGMKLGMSNGATWTATGDSFVNEMSGNGGTIKVDMASEDAVAKVSIDSFVNGSEKEKFTVGATGAVADYIAGLSVDEQDEAMKSVVDAVTVGKDEAAETLADTVTTDEGLIAGAYTITRNAEDDGVSYTQAANKTNTAIGESAVALKAHWRAHMNDMNKRMGELRMANGETGVWTRMVRGEAEYEGVKAQYNQYQLGYDEKLSVDKRWTVGAAVTFSEGDSSFYKGSSEDDSTAFAIYGSKLNNDGTYVDLIARYARLESDITTATDKSDYSTNGMSVSAEFGKRIQQGKGLWIEPQFELTYGTVDSAEYVLDGKNVQVGDMDSLIGRVGFSIGKDIEKGNVYARASYLYDFDGETTTTFSAGGLTDPIKDDLGGGWWEVGVGANINLSKATYIYADIEKTFGGEVDTSWQWNLGVRYSF